MVSTDSVCGGERFLCVNPKYGSALNPLPPHSARRIGAPRTNPDRLWGKMYSWTFFDTKSSPLVGYSIGPALLDPRQTVARRNVCQHAGICITEVESRFPTTETHFGKSSWRNSQPQPGGDSATSRETTFRRRRGHNHREEKKSLEFLWGAGRISWFLQQQQTGLALRWLPSLRSRSFAVNRLGAEELSRQMAAGS